MISGFIRLGQLAFGILIAAQVTGLGDSNLVDNPNNAIGPWAPWVGVLVYAVGTTLFFGPPQWFLPWMVAILLVSYSGQVSATRCRQLCQRILRRRRPDDRRGPHLPDSATLPRRWR